MDQCYVQAIHGLYNSCAIHRLHNSHIHTSVHYRSVEVRLVQASWLKGKPLKNISPAPLYKEEWEQSDQSKEIVAYLSASKDVKSQFSIQVLGKVCRFGLLVLGLKNVIYLSAETPTNSGEIFLACAF